MLVLGLHNENLHKFEFCQIDLFFALLEDQIQLYSLNHPQKKTISTLYPLDVQGISQVHHHEHEKPLFEKPDHYGDIVEQLD